MIFQPPYEGSYKIVSRSEKVFWILRNGEEVFVSVNRLKPAYAPKNLADGFSTPTCLYRQDDPTCLTAKIDANLLYSQIDPTLPATEGQPC
ncbi:hypothetical protein NPIL_329501 [Nephila pilipes]|uniref:Uncharacterized protein n=1 Tax=Nephila pilipes TaxID=299642 RepID=A0A8X6I8K1_NEPPI|nr:hypothetical protein NPIL_329501 [Nephila pilipes]